MSTSDEIQAQLQELNTEAVKEIAPVAEPLELLIYKKMFCSDDMVQVKESR